MCGFILCSLISLILLNAPFESQGTVLRQRQFYTLHQWSHGINMTFPTLIDREFAANNGYYNVNLIQLPVDISVEYKGKKDFAIPANSCFYFYLKIYFFNNYFYLKGHN